jgi:hypothetical protein
MNSSGPILDGNIRAFEMDSKTHLLEKGITL